MKIQEACPRIRQTLHGIEDQLADLIKFLRSNGFDDTASDMLQIMSFSRIYTKPGGMLHYLEAPAPTDEPSEVQS